VLFFHSLTVKPSLTEQNNSVTFQFPFWPRCAWGIRDNLCTVTNSNASRAGCKYPIRLVKYAITMLKNNKDPGADGIYAEVLKCGGEALATALHAVFGLPGARDVFRRIRMPTSCLYFKTIVASLPKPVLNLIPLSAWAKPWSSRRDKVYLH